MHPTLLALLAVATPDASIASPDGSTAGSDFLAPDQEIVWIELPDPDPERILPPIKGLWADIETAPRQPASASSQLRSLAEAERKINDDLRRAEEAVAKAGAAVAKAEATIRGAENGN